MVNTALVYQTKFQKTLHEASVHLARIDEALDELGKKYQFPIAQKQFAELLTKYDWRQVVQGFFTLSGRKR